jgi:hypothetical protein
MEIKKEWKVKNDDGHVKKVRNKKSRLSTPREDDLSFTHESTNYFFASSISTSLTSISVT